MESLGGATHETQTGWYVVQTKRHRERVACSFLRYHFETYLPLVREDPPPAVGNEVAPMFPCYLFVRAPLPSAYYQITRTACVKDFVRVSGDPGVISEDVIDALRRREGPDGLVRCGSRLTAGCRVEIVRGAFQGVEAILESRLPSRERVRVLLSLFQRPSAVEIPASWVRKRA